MVIDLISLTKISSSNFLKDFLKTQIVYVNATSSNKKAVVIIAIAILLSNVYTTFDDM